MRGIFTIGAAVWMAVAGAVAPAQADGSPVVVELFTSQGCSSCPPADALLAELGARSDVIPLALHVDYWDYIGWKDRFASPRFTKRQKGYARAAGESMVYTPQIVVNGRDEVVGSNPDKVRALIERHASAKADTHVELSLTRYGDRVTIHAEGGDEIRPCDIHVIRYDNAREVMIKRGENAGRTITYTHIVRDWDVAGRWDGTGRFTGEVSVPEGMPVVVLVQTPGFGPILAAARLE